MENIEQFISEYERLLILGVGNPLREDDRAGIELIESLYQKLLDLNSINTDDIYLISCQTTPENYTGQIRRIAPSHMILVDAAEMEKQPGTIEIIDKNQIDELNFSTHSMALSFILNYIEKTIGTKTQIIAIQPKSMNMSNKMSPEVIKSTQQLSDMIFESIKNKKK